MKDKFRIVEVNNKFYPQYRPAWWPFWFSMWEEGKSPREDDFATIIHRNSLEQAILEIEKFKVEEEAYFRRKERKIHIVE